MDTSDSTTCKNSLSNCRQAAPGTRPLEQHQGNQIENKNKNNIISLLVGVTGVMAMLGLETSELPSTPSLPQTTALPTVASASLDELTTIGPDFRLTTSAPDIDGGAKDEVDYVTEQSGEKEAGATTGTPTFFTAESQPSTSPGLSTLPDERDSVLERGSTTDSSQATPGYELETQTPEERSEDKGVQNEVTERTMHSEDSRTDGFTTQGSITTEPSIEGSTLVRNLVGGSFNEEDAFTGPSVNVISSTRPTSGILSSEKPTSGIFGSEESPSSDFTTDSSRPSAATSPVDSDTRGATSKDMNGELTTEGFEIEATTREEFITGPSHSTESDSSLEHTTAGTTTNQINTVQVSTEETTTDRSRQTENDDASGEFVDSLTDITTEKSRPFDGGSLEVNSEVSTEGGVDIKAIATEATGTSGESITSSQSSQTESDLSGESASAQPLPSSSTASEKIGIIHETGISDTTNPPLSVEDLANLLKNSTLLSNPDNIDFGGLSEEFGNDTLFIIEDILVDSDGRVISSTATTNLADNILPNTLDPNRLNTLGDVLDRQNNQDQNSQTVNADEGHKGKAEEEGDQIAGSDHQGNSGTDKGEVEIDDDAEPSQSSIRPEIDASAAAIPPNPAAGTENQPADLSGRPEPEEGINIADRPNDGTSVPLGSSEDHAPNTFDPDNNLSGATGEPGVIGERQRDDPGAEEADGPTAQTTARQESDGPAAASEKGGEKSSSNQEGVADQQKNEEDRGNYPNDQVTSPSVPSDYTLNDASDETTTETSTHSQTTNPATPLSRKVEDEQAEESFPSMVPGLKEEDAEFEEQEEECLRRYTEARRSVDISYYNTTVRTRLLTAICLEGIRCEPGQDATRCQFLHSKCNQQVDTSKLSFGMRVTLSECTVEDVLCHLGHRTPVMCCQDR